MVLFFDALRLAHHNRARRAPSSSDPRSSGGLLFPVFTPKFPVSFEGSTVFTLGSCFARNIEDTLVSRGVTLPTLAFAVPPTEYPYRGNGLLNEFNPGAMAQRILFALGGKDYPEETIVQAGDQWIDLLLPNDARGVTRERALERRKQIATIYTSLSSANLVIITLGLVEAWYDNETKLFLNRMPPNSVAAKQRRRYAFRRLNMSDCVHLLEEALGALTAAGPRVLLTVSPVPLQTTFVAQDCVVANEYSKSVLRVTAERLAANPAIDYFPSYEIVRSGGLTSYQQDQVHVRPDIVDRVTAYMLEAYAGASAQSSSGSDPLNFAV